MDAIINGYLNYMLDPYCSTEHSPNSFIECGRNLKFRQGICEFVGRITDSGEFTNHSFPWYLSQEVKLICLGEEFPGRNVFPSIKEQPLEMGTQVCAFCERGRAMYKFRACHMHLCKIENLSLRGTSYVLRFHHSWHS